MPLPDPDIFFFESYTEVLLPHIPPKWCALGKHDLPATAEFFLPRRHWRSKKWTWDPYCRECRRAQNRIYVQRRKEKAA